ncbi:UNVERIFIED_CONTAM: hypothetical protein PYX00_000990 [Menopon gallinae]|uniref:Resistance to inhibitors of cholinesterase protein 3 N-terminal domain-containing protein n=1 Tax=Menopon gallinae TaxID=328185 RepID=A0AAW2ICC9_9NEOP
MANVEFGTGKTVLILTIVAACFAVLWPKIFYPMLVSSPGGKPQSDNLNGHLRQERPLHLRPEMMHPALRERGRAIPQSNLDSKVTIERDGSIRPPPVPGMRPPMGGPGHVVPPPKVGATMSIVMPLYTIGIVIFSMYTIMKVFIRKTGNSDNYKDFNSDPEFRRMVFAEEYSNGCAGSAKEDAFGPRAKRESPPTLWKAPSDEGTRLGWKERDTRDVEIDYLRKRLEETERAMERIVAQIGTIPGKIDSNCHKDYGKALEKEEKKTAEDICTEEVRPSGKADISKAEQAVSEEVPGSQQERETAAADSDGENQCEHLNEKLEEENYTTATMSDGAHAAFMPETEDTGADLSNIDALDTAEDQEEFQEDDQVWNGAESPSSDEQNVQKDDD